MTDRIRSSRRLIFLGSALLAAAAVALLLAAVFTVHAVIFGLLALTLVIVATRASDRPRASIAILHGISALAIVLGIVLVGIATALVQGPSRSAATFIMFLSGAADFAAAGLVVAAASRLPGAAASEDASAWKLRVAPAALLGVGSVVLMWFLGGVRMVPATVPAAEYFGGLILAVVAGGYSMLVTYVLLRGLPPERRNLWIVFALNAALLLAASILLISEPNNSQLPLVLGITIFSIACSYGGLTLAVRGARRHETA